MLCFKYYKNNLLAIYIIITKSNNNLNYYILGYVILARIFITFT